MANAESLFSGASFLALAGWALLLVAAFLARREPLVVAARIVSALLAGLYVVLVARGLLSGGGMPEGAGFDTLAGVEALFSRREAILGAWVHFLAFDLFVGAWEAEDAKRHGVPGWAVAPALVLTLLAGPAGLMLYLLARLSLARRR